jgi:hypothetical protein
MASILPASVDKDLHLSSQGKVVCKLSQDKGKGLFATRDIRKGELILRNEVLVEGEDTDSDRISNHESKELSSSSSKGDEREDSFDDISEDEQDYEFSSSIRAYELQVNVKMAVNLIRRYPEVLSYLHCPEPKDLILRFEHVSIPPILLEYEPNISQEKWIKTLGILEYNIFGSEEFSQLHTLISLANHDCQPNCEVITNGLFASTPISAGTELTISYPGENFWSVSFKNRQKRLFEKWAFICHCTLCHQ